MAMSESVHMGALEKERQREEYLSAVRVHLLDLDTPAFNEGEGEVLAQLVAQHLERPSKKRLAPYETALLFDWGIKENVVLGWRNKPKLTLTALSSEFEAAMRSRLEAMTSLVYTTRDGAYMVEQLHGNQSVTMVGMALNVCIKDLKKGAGRRYAEALKPRAPGGRGALELFIMRPNAKAGVPRPSIGQESLVRPDPALLFSYHPETRTIREVEKHSLPNGLPGLLQRNDPLLPPFLETVRAMRTGIVPDTPVDTVGDLESTVQPRGILYDTGEMVQMSGARPELSIAGGKLSVNADDRTLAPSRLERIARELPVTVDMTNASAQQRGALTSVRGSLVDGVLFFSVSYPNLRSIGFNLFFRSSHFEAPNLVSIGHTIHALRKNSMVHAPLLDTFFTLYASPSATIVTALTPSELKARRVAIAV